MGANVLVAHGGGPTTVINGSLYGVITEAKKYPNIGKIYGAVHGIEGVFNEKFVDLSAADPHQIELLPQTPSSILGSCRRKVKEEDFPRILEVLKKYDIRYFFYNGGNDSMDTCNKISILAKRTGYELAVVGIPKTIDNDLAYTDHCPGYGSAARFIARNTYDLWMEVQAMPLYVTIMETMGRNAGWLTAAASIPRYNDKPCAQLLYLPEVVFQKDKFLADVDNLLRKQKEILIVVSEGLRDASGEMIASQNYVDGFGHKLAGGSAQALCEMITQDLHYSARAERGGFLGRASMVLQSAQDREEAIAVGKRAVQLALNGTTGVMVSIVRDGDSPYRYSLGTADLAKVANVEKKLPAEYIVPEGNNVVDAFCTYATPLIGDSFPDYANIRRAV